MAAEPGKLYLVATPIGNLGDISFRAVEILRTVDLIACEDTRHTRKLLNAYSIKAKLISYHEHNEKERAENFVSDLAAGMSIAVVSDAGTPGINDPGAAVVRQCIANGIEVIPLPGPAAFVSAAVISGLATDALYFGGFLPSKTAERRRTLTAAAAIPATLIFYESPHRIAASLADCAAVLGSRQAAIVRELTKLHEETLRGTLPELRDIALREPVKGEIALVIDRGSEDVPAASADDLAAIVARFEAAGDDRRTALKKAARETGLSRSEAYRRLHG